MDALSPSRLLSLALIALLSGITGAVLICPVISERESRRVYVHMQHVEQINAQLSHRVRQLENSYAR